MKKSYVRDFIGFFYNFREQVVLSDMEKQVLFQRILEEFDFKIVSVFYLFFTDFFIFYVKLIKLFGMQYFE